MLYTLFIYQSNSGLLMFDKSFQDISSGKMELFGSFFSAIKSFISELVLDGSTELKSISMGDYDVTITSMNSIKSDLVLIADREDSKLVNKIIPKILKILGKHQEVFIEWNGNRGAFAGLEQPLSELINSNKKLVGDSSLLENPEELLKSMWAHKGELTQQARDGLTQEKDFLTDRLNNTQNILRKVAISEKVLELSEQLKDDSEFIKYQRQVKTLRDEAKDIKIKLQYYLERFKTTLSTEIEMLGNKRLKQGDFKDTYLALYSFSSKLKLISTNREWEKYRDMATILINKDETDDHVLSETISNILQMKDDLVSYIDSN